MDLEMFEACFDEADRIIAKFSLLSLFPLYLDIIILFLN